jgi:hypothetical protein
VKLQNDKMSKDYITNNKFKKNLKKIVALAFVPDDKVFSMYINLVEYFLNEYINEYLLNFLFWFERTIL